MAGVRKVARQNKEMKFTALLHHLTVELLRESDIFFQFEGNILIEFALVLKEAMVAYSDWDGQENTLDEAISKIFHSLNAGDEFINMVKELLEVANLTQKGQNKTRPITLEDVAKMKVVCDAYLNLQARQHLQQEIASGKLQPVAQGDVPK